jgi:hypothetical protein
VTGERPRGFEIGIFIFGEITADAAAGRRWEGWHRDRG